MPSSLNSSSLHIVAILGFAFGPLGGGGIGSRLLGPDLRRQRHEVGIDIVLDFLILDVFREDQQGSGVVAGERRDGLGGACEAKTAENQGGAGCGESVAHGDEISLGREFRPPFRMLGAGRRGAA